MVGRARASPEKWEDPCSKPQRNKRQADSGLGRGRGAWELQPALCWPGREVHSTQTQSTRAFSTPRGMQTGTGRGDPIRPAPLHLQLTQEGSQPPQVGYGYVGIDTEHPSSPKAGVDKGHLPQHLGSLNTVFLSVVKIPPPIKFY